MNRSFYLHLASAQECSAATQALARLADVIKLVAALPAGGGAVLVSSPSERREISDLILQHRGTAVLDATKLAVCVDANAEFAAAAGRVTTKLFLAPGYRPKSSPSFWQGALEFNVQGGWWRPTAPEAVARSVPVPSCWEETTPIAEPDAPPFASVTLAPLPRATATDPGPWHRPDPQAPVPVRDPVVTITMRHEADAICPFVLRAWLAPACTTCLVECFVSQAAADAALPAFAARVRAAQAIPGLAHPRAVRKAA